VPIGEWVLRQACGQVVSWLESGLKAVPVAVNLSPAQFRVADLLERIASILNETTLDPSYLAIEVTESMTMRDAMEAHDAPSDRSTSRVSVPAGGGGRFLGGPTRGTCACAG